MQEFSDLVNSTNDYMSYWSIDAIISVTFIERKAVCYDWKVTEKIEPQSS
jgi:hypothetical protein